MQDETTKKWNMCSAFHNMSLVASGCLEEVVKVVRETSEPSAVLIFDDMTGEQIDVDFSGSVEDMLAKIDYRRSPAVNRGPGRPKLGVTAREVTLLPRHWDWLNTQPGGASVALRRLVEEARKNDKANFRPSQDATYKFMSAIAGNEPGFEEAARSLYTRDRQIFVQSITQWPDDVRSHALKMAGPSFNV